MTQTTPQRFHWWITGAHLWIIAGLFLDGWHHIHGPDLETFFTPWHGLLYSGVGLAVVIIAEQMRRARRAGSSRREAVPPGYGLAAVGGVVFAAGGVLDMLWHEILGIEVGVEALLSPTHLTLAVAGVLVFGAPLRAAWGSASSARGWNGLGPSVVSLMCIVALLAFFTQYVSPITHLYPTLEAGPGENVDLLHAAGIAGIVIHSAIVTGALLIAALRWRLPRGAATVIVAGSTLLMATQRGTYELLPAALLAGLLADVLLHRLQPSERGPAAVRIVAAAVPALLFTGYFITLAVGGSLTWSVHLVTGGIALAAATGTFLSVLLLAPVGRVEPVAAPGQPAKRTAPAGTRV